jgi:hypothetical protein
MTPCSLAESCLRLGETCYLRFLCRR